MGQRSTGALARQRCSLGCEVQLIPGGDAELIKELQKHNVQFAVVPPPTAGPAPAPNPEPGRRARRTGRGEAVQAEVKAQQVP